MTRIKHGLHEYFYPILFGIILLQLFLIPEIRLGVASSILIIFLALMGISRKNLLRNSSHNKLVLAYIAYNTLSITLYSVNGLPISVFVAEWSNSILPMFFYYFAFKENDIKDNFFELTLYVLIFSFIVGFVLWISNSDIYRVFMDTTEGSGTDLLFFQSLFGLTATGAFGVIGFLISSSLVFKSHGKKGKILLLICALAAILTFRRAAIATLIFSFIVMHYIAYFKYNFIKKRYIFLEIFFLYLIYLLLADEYGDLFSNIIERGSMISDAFESRNDTWKYAFDFSNLVFGKGLGAVGHKAVGFTTDLIPDGNYFKILAETGIPGFLLFSFIIISALMSGGKRLKEKYLELGIVLTMCMIAIGSNIFTYQSVAPAFWYSIGQLSRHRKA